LASQEIPLLDDIVVEGVMTAVAETAQSTVAAVVTASGAAGVSAAFCAGRMAAVMPARKADGAGEPADGKRSGKQQTQADFSDR
jgi:hypothetical protein